MSAKSFYKLEASENDFVLFSEPPPTDAAELKALVLNACRLHSGIGADGVVFAYQQNPLQKSSWNWRFFNLDGSETDVCGNAARCMAAFLVRQGANSQSIEWTGSLGTFKAREIRKNKFAVNWPLKSSSQLEIPTELMDDLLPFNDWGLASAQWINSGVPHLVLINHEQWSLEHRLTNGPDLRRHPALGPEGANVTWLSLKTLDCVTFERGVEKETRACGSGAIAAYMALEKHIDQNAADEDKGKGVGTVNLRFPGGILNVSRDAQNTDQIWLEGSARIVFQGTWEI